MPIKNNCTIKFHFVISYITYVQSFIVKDRGLHGSPSKSDMLILKATALNPSKLVVALSHCVTRGGGRKSALQLANSHQRLAIRVCGVRASCCRFTKCCSFVEQLTSAHTRA